MQSPHSAVDFKTSENVCKCSVGLRWVRLRATHAIEFDVCTTMPVLVSNAVSSHAEHAGSQTPIRHVRPIRTNAQSDVLKAFYNPSSQVISKRAKQNMKPEIPSTLDGVDKLESIGDVSGVHQTQAYHLLHGLNNRPKLQQQVALSPLTPPSICFVPPCLQCVVVADVLVHGSASGL